MAWWLDVLVTGRAYLIFSFLSFGLLGVALLGLPLRAADSTQHHVGSSAGPGIG